MRPGDTRYWRERRVHGDLRLLIGTAEQKAEALRQIERRSAAAKAGWAKRRAASAIEARRVETAQTGSIEDESAASQSEETPNPCHPSGDSHA